MIFPWQQQEWQQLYRSYEEKRLPHALLLTGISGTGKAHFAEIFSRALLCGDEQWKNFSNKKHDCHVCRMIAGRVHPNLLWVEPEKEGQAIKIDQIRATSEFVSQSSLQGQYRIVIIHPANNMNLSAANALLKTLEEPAADALMILISDQPGRLPATILSRCQRVNFPRPDPKLALTWLKDQLKDNTLDAQLLLNLSQGAPLAALRLKEGDLLPSRQEWFAALYSLSQKKADPLQVAASAQSIEPLALLDFTLSWMLDLLRLQLNSGEAIINEDFSAALLDLTQFTFVEKNLQFTDYLQRLRGQLCTGINFNKQLMVESILIKWCDMTQESKRIAPCS